MCNQARVQRIAAARLVLPLHLGVLDEGALAEDLNEPVFDNLDFIGLKEVDRVLKDLTTL